MARAEGTEATQRAYALARRGSQAKGALTARGPPIPASWLIWVLHPQRELEDRASNIVEQIVKDKPKLATD